MGEIVKIWEVRDDIGTLSALRRLVPFGVRFGPRIEAPYLIASPGSTMSAPMPSWPPASGAPQSATYRPARSICPIFAHDNTEATFRSATVKDEPIRYPVFASA
jgi:hypothetical protein